MAFSKMQIEFYEIVRVKFSIGKQLNYGQVGLCSRKELQICLLMRNEAAEFMEGLTLR